MSVQQTFEQYNLALLAATPTIAEEILDFTHEMPVFMANLYETEAWTGNENVRQQLIFRGSMPEVETGFSRWKALANAAGCSPCLDDCSYNFTQFNSGAFERRMVSLMSREFRTQPICVNEIASTHEYEEVFTHIVRDIQQQVQFFKEYNIGHNFLVGIARKLLVASSGPQGNAEDPYSYRALGTATLSKLSTKITSKIYEGMRRRTDVRPFDIINGRPVYAISASDEVIDELYLEDAQARQDIRFSSQADALLNKYNFMSSIRGQFLNAPIMYPRRANYVNNQWVFVDPYVNGIPAEVGTFSDLNPAWENSDYEEVLFYGATPFKLFYRSPYATVGAGTSFGPEPTFMTEWQWINVQTEADPFKRQGFFATSAKIALAAQWSGGVYGLMVPRASNSLLSSFYPAPICPPDEVTCDNNLPSVSTPCPLVVSAVRNPVTPTRWFLTFGTAIAGSPSDPIQLGVGTGGYVTGTIISISGDGFSAEISFAAGVDITECSRITQVFCDNTLGCSSDVLAVNDCRSGVTGQFEVTLLNPIKAVTAADEITACMGDGSTQTLEVVSVDMLNNLWVVKYAAGSGPTDDPTGAGTDAQVNDGVNCDRNGIVRVCVPTATDATCPACAACA